MTLQTYINIVIIVPNKQNLSGRIIICMDRFISGDINLETLPFPKPYNPG